MMPLHYMTAGIIAMHCVWPSLLMVHMTGSPRTCMLCSQRPTFLLIGVVLSSYKSYNVDEPANYCSL